MEPTEYSAITISWDVDAEGNRLVLIECRGDDGAPLWQHTMPMASAVTFGNSLAELAGLPAVEAPVCRPEVEDLWPVCADPSEFLLQEHLPQSLDFDLALD